MSGMRDFEAEAKDRLKDHVIRSEPAQRWHVSSPHDRFHWYNVVWFPGTLQISGDLGALTMTHHQALRNLDQGARWVGGSHLDYLLSKTDAKSDHLDVEATADYLVKSAIECRDMGNGLGDDRYWKVLVEAFGTFLDPEDDDEEEMLAAIQSCDNDLPRAIHEMEVWDDFYGVYGYDFHDIWRVTALQRWGKELDKQNAAKPKEAVLI